MTGAGRARARTSAAGRTAVPDAPVTPGRVTVRARLGRRGLEGLRLEVGRLALSLGLAVAEVRVRRIDSDGDATPAARRARPRRG